jgi:hypothetical protein
MEFDLDSHRIKKTGTREEVFKGIASRTAGGLKKDDIIPKQFGSRVLYISKRLSERMRQNFNIIRASNPNHFKRQIKKTMCVSNLPSSSNPMVSTPMVSTPMVSSTENNTNRKDKIDNKKRQYSKTMKLAFKIDENVQKNIYYKELKGMDIKELKEELKREEAEEDLGIPQTNNTKKEFTIETMPDIDISSLQ